MTKLLLKFEDSVLKEMPVDTDEVRIGRSPENGLVIDNPAVSHHHARVFSEQGRLMLEDCGSMNGTFVNGQRVKIVSLKPGDSVAIGKHTIFVADAPEDADSIAFSAPAKMAVPKINETVMLGTKVRLDFLQQAAAVGESAQIAPARLKVATLVVRRGRTDRQEYTLTDKLTVIGKSAMSTVKLKGWFAPRAAAQINRREDQSYYIGAGDKTPMVNGQLIARPTKLAPGDFIEVAGTQLEFVYRD
jgi:pSer/pThr/pTyr-binding forkhead associated (FHA) protein